QQVNQVDGLVLESYLLQQLNDDATARTKLDQALELAPDNYPAMRFLMLMNAREKRFDEARTLAETLLKSSNNAEGKFQLVLTLINLAIQQDDLTSVESLLRSLLDNQATDDKNDGQELKVGLATIYNYQGEYRKALDILKDIEAKNDFFVLSELGQTYIEMDDFKNAKATFQTLVSSFPRNTLSWNKLINLLNQYGFQAEAAEVASNAETAIPQDPRLTVLNIRALIRAGDIRKAKQKIDKMKAQGNSSPMFELFEGEIALHDKEYDKASKLLSNYYSKDPSWDTAIPLAKALAQLGKVPLGGKYLVEQAAKSRVKFKNIHYIAEYYAQNGELDSAAIYYKGLLDLNPKDFVTLNNYSTLAIEQGNIAQAIELAQKANQLYPESPYAMDTLGWALFHDKKYGDALTYIKKAHEALPQNNEVTLHLIEVLISTGSKDKAKTLSNRLKPANDREKQTLSRLNASI
ncbi:tetratricopeptide repeat protein, partial [uncultured Paraglaciecola sp.]|uniref:tetratricopeptide repeat protein n=1 Tax=uncultured Paraglaciecola sp. TaxID=1765024 RepID=UPI0030DDCB07